VYVKARVIPIVIGALRMITRGQVENLRIMIRVELIHSVALGTTRYERRYSSMARRQQKRKWWYVKMFPGYET